MTKEVFCIIEITRPVKGFPLTAKAKQFSDAIYSRELEAFGTLSIEEIRALQDNASGNEKDFFTRVRSLVSALSLTSIEQMLFLRVTPPPDSIDSNICIPGGVHTTSSVEIRVLRNGSNFIIELVAETNLGTLHYELGESSGEINRGEQADAELSWVDIPHVYDLLVSAELGMRDPFAVQ